MMFAALPPSSSVSFFPLPATARMISLPTSVEPVKAILSTSGCLTSAAPVAPVARDDVDDAGGQLRLAEHVGEEQRGQRRRLGGLEHDRVPGRERRRDLPGQHEQREVPGDDLPGDADRPRPCGWGRRTRACRPSPRSRRSARRESGRSTSRDSRIGLPPSSDSSTANSRERSCRMRAIRKRYFARSLGAQLGPAVRERVAGGAHGEVDVLGAGVGDLGERLLVARGDARRRTRPSAGSTHSPPTKRP